MKTMSLVDCMELKFSGSILKNAIYFGDMDNDGLNELIIGNCNGDLAVFRGDKCIYTSADLGTIAAITVGDLLNIGRNVLIAVTIEGWCHIFATPDDETSSCYNNKHENEPEFSMIWPFHSQRIPPNAKTLHLGDVNEDDMKELVIGLTDRVLRTYVWKTEPLYEYQDDRNLSKSDERDEADARSESMEAYDGRLYSVNKWEFASQIGSIALQRREGKYCSIIVGQPGGSVTNIIESKKSKCSAPASSLPSSNPSSSAGSTNANSNNNSSNVPTTAATGNKNNRIPQQERPTTQNGDIQIQYYPLDLSRMQNPNISTEVVGNIASPDRKDCDYYAVATLDGTINIAKDNNIERSLQVDNQILSIHEVNGKLVCCSWNGETYLIDPSEKEPTRFYFEDSVAAFFAGYYAWKDDNSSENNCKLVNTTCLAFATFNERIFIYNVDYL